MKLVIILAAVTLAQAATLSRVYLPPNAQSSGGSAKFLQAPYRSPNIAVAQNANTYSGAANSKAIAQKTYSGFKDSTERPQAAKERKAAILALENTNDVDSYYVSFETENGISADESAIATDGVKAQGGYSYTGDDGKVYSVRYTADEYGFLPQGNHLPTPPPIPEEIMKALEQNARDEAAGIFDDGSYKEEYDADGSQQQYYSSKPQRNTNKKNSDAIQKTYIPPFAQRNNKIFNGY